MGPASLDLCIALVEYATKFGRQKRGVASAYVAGLGPGDAVRLTVEAGALADPGADVPLLCVAPGTGLAPARALLQERALSGAPDSMIFLGFRYSDQDFLFAGEWEAIAPQLEIAFSREVKYRKVYVQDKIAEKQREVAELLAGPRARVFVCGRAHPMPGQVFDAFVDVLVKGGAPEPAARRQLRSMQAAGRYVEDTWG